MAEDILNQPEGADAGRDRSKEVNAPQDGSGSPTRRGLIKAGLISAPIILTLRSRPAWGRTQTPSAAQSLTHSSNPTGF
jgi:hypothetical protein